MNSADEIISTMMDETARSKTAMKETMLKTLEQSTEVIKKELDDDTHNHTILILFGVVMIMLCCVLRKFRQVEKRHIL